MIDTKKLREQLAGYRKTGESWIVAENMLRSPDIERAGLRTMAYDLTHEYCSYQDALGLIEYYEAWVKRGCPDWSQR